MKGLGILKNRTFLDGLIFLSLIFIVGGIFYTSRNMSIVYFYAYTRLLYIRIIISALRFGVKTSLIIPTIVSIGEFLEIYLTEKSHILLVTFMISVPTYYFVSISISYFRIQAEKLSEMVEKIQEKLKHMENAMISALEAKDVYTKGHSQRVCKLVTQIV